MYLNVKSIFLHIYENLLFGVRPSAWQIQIISNEIQLLLQAHSQSWLTVLTWTYYNSLNQGQQD